MNQPPSHVPRERLAARHVLHALGPFTTERGGPLVVKEIAYAEGRSNVIIEYPGATTHTHTHMYIYICIYIYIYIHTHTHTQNTHTHTHRHTHADTHAHTFTATATAIATSFNSSCTVNAQDPVRRQSRLLAPTSTWYIMPMQTIGKKVSTS